MTIRILALALFLVGLWSPVFAKENIILIMADDVGYECFGCYGSRQYKTPCIDRMAARGMRFVRDQRWKLYGDGRFYDVANDPEEKSPISEKNDAWKKLSIALASMPPKGESLLQFGSSDP